VFLGASYFRALGKEHVYGLSARGLGLDTAMPSGEEFPFFASSGSSGRAPAHASWCSTRCSTAEHHRCLSLRGAAGCADRDGRGRARLLPTRGGESRPRPLTSMFFFGEGDSHGSTTVRGARLRRPADRRPQRRMELAPLQNPRRLRISSFNSPSPVGFGLLQRDATSTTSRTRDAQEQRPSAWWRRRASGPRPRRAGRDPTDSERHDNIVAYWVPLARGLRRSASFAYELRFYSEDSTLPPGGRAVATRRDRGTHDDSWRYVVDFEGPASRPSPRRSCCRACQLALVGRRRRGHRAAGAEEPVTAAGGSCSSAAAWRCARGPARVPAPGRADAHRNLGGYARAVTEPARQGESAPLETTARSRRSGCCTLALGARSRERVPRGARVPPTEAAEFAWQSVAIAASEPHWPAGAGAPHGARDAAQAAGRRAGRRDRRERGFLRWRLARMLVGAGSVRAALARCRRLRDAPELRRAT